jgi:hopanoid biosynthesis associated radical SAM protein HpnH
MSPRCPPWKASRNASPSGCRPNWRTGPLEPARASWRFPCCNLTCSGCGKIDYPDEILDQRLSLADCLGAVDECGAPVVSIAGGEPLLHKDMPAIVQGVVARRKFVYLCTNALLMEKKLDQYQPSRFFIWSVHIDGDEAMHDRSVCQSGVYRRAVAAIRRAKEAGFRVNINCTLFHDADPDGVARFFDTVKRMRELLPGIPALLSWHWFETRRLKTQGSQPL